VGSEGTTREDIVIGTICKLMLRAFSDHVVRKGGPDFLQTIFIIMVTKHFGMKGKMIYWPHGQEKLAV
jgi:hypothetical protein